MPESLPGSVRLDKWLWAARFFKTRALAQEAVDGGRVKLNALRAKSAKQIRPGDVVSVRVGDMDWEITVRALSERRGSAELARTLYEESEESRLARSHALEQRRLGGAHAIQGEGRPTKRDRRQLDRLRGEDQ